MLSLSVKTWAQHFLNPLHICCRLLDLNIGRQTAWKITCPYEALRESILPRLGMVQMQRRPSREQWRNGRKGHLQ